MKRISNKLLLPIVLPVFALLVVPQAVIMASKPARLLEIGIFSVIAIGWMVAYFLWFGERRSWWHQLIVLLVTWGVTVAFTAVFSVDFSNAYLSFMLATQIIFALRGLWPGLAMLGLSLAATIYSLYINGGMSLNTHVFALSVICALGLLTWYFVSTANNAKEEAERLAAEVTELNRLLVISQENERRHLARELHDEIGQALTAVKIDLQAVQRLRGGSALGPRLQQSIGTVDQTLQQVRNLTVDLRSSMLDDLGLVSALRWSVDRTAERAGLEVHFDADLLDGRLPVEIEAACFRIAQEALTNIVRHAQAQRVWVELRQADSGSAIELAIRDDGVGFDPQAALQAAARGASVGLQGMLERAELAGGQLDIESWPEQGTTIRARFPLADASKPPGVSERAITV